MILSGDARLIRIASKSLVRADRSWNEGLMVVLFLMLAGGRPEGLHYNCIGAAAGAGLFQWRRGSPDGRRRYTSSTGAGAPPPARTDADAAPSVPHGRRRYTSSN